MDDQARHLRDHISKNKQAKTIAVVSGKGGVGKSNTALNFSLALQQRGKKVLLIDLDIGMGNVDILLGIHPTYSMADLLEDFIPFHDMIELGPYGLSYIAGGSSLNKLIEMDEAKLNFFYREYDKVVYKYDYILFDLGAGVSDSSLAFILAADECMVITTPEPTSLTDAYSMMKHIVYKKIDIPISVLINRCSNSKEGERVLANLQKVMRNFLDYDIKKLGIVPYDRTVEKAVMNQTPYLIYDSKSPVSLAMNKIVSNYLHQVDELMELKPLTFVQKLKRLFVKR